MQTNNSNGKCNGNGKVNDNGDNKDDNDKVDNNEMPLVMLMEMVLSIVKYPCYCQSRMPRMPHIMQGGTSKS